MNNRRQRLRPGQSGRSEDETVEKRERAQGQWKQAAEGRHTLQGIESGEDPTNSHDTGASLT